MTQKLDTNDWQEARTLGAIAMMLNERKTKIEAQIETIRMQHELLRRDLTDVTTKAKDADAALSDFAQTLSGKYGLTDGDQINFEDGQIIKAKPDAAVTPAPATETP